MFDVSIHPGADSFTGSKEKIYHTYFAQHIGLGERLTIFINKCERFYIAQYRCFSLPIISAGKNRYEKNEDNCTKKNYVPDNFLAFHITRDKRQNYYLYLPGNCKKAVNFNKQKLQLCCKLHIFATMAANKMQLKINWDALGISASIACAIHCAILPLFLSSLPLFGINIIGNLYFECLMIFLAFCIGAFSLYHGLKKHHHKKSPLILFSIGIAFLLAKQAWHQYEIMLLVPAVLLIVGAHFLNYRLCRKARHCHSSDCNH